MSSTLYWEPAYPKRNNSLDDKLKLLLRKGYNNPIDWELSDSDFSYFQGLADAGMKDAGEIVNAIKIHGRIRLVEKF